FARAMIGIHAEVELKDTLVVEVPKIEVDVASSSGTKIVTLYPFDVLNMVDKDIGVTPIDSVNSKGDDANVGNSKDVNLDNEDDHSEDDVEDDDNETVSFLSLKNYKGKCSSKSGGGTGKEIIYERRKDDYHNNPYDDDEE
ncbi:hypothetical protein Tco_0341577, partial [Tanacetum coccineum]